MREASLVTCNHHLDRPIPSHQKRTAALNVTVHPSGLDSIQAENPQWGYSIDLSISYSSLCSWEYPSEYLPYSPAIRNRALDCYQGEGDWMDFPEDLEPSPLSKQLENSVFSR